MINNLILTTFNVCFTWNKALLNCVSYYSIQDYQKRQSQSFVQYLVLKRKSENFMNNFFSGPQNCFDTLKYYLNKIWSAKHNLQNAQLRAYLALKLWNGHDAGEMRTNSDQIRTRSRTRYGQATGKNHL